MVRPSGIAGTPFTPLNPPLPLRPTPEAFYAHSAGTVSELQSGQAVTSFNGLTDSILLQAGTGIYLGTNGNTLTISTRPIPLAKSKAASEPGAADRQEQISRLQRRVEQLEKELTQLKRAMNGTSHRTE